MSASQNERGGAPALPRITLQAVAAFCARHGIPESRFGRESVNDPALVLNMRRGRELRSATEARVRAHMGRVEACHG